MGARSLTQSMQQMVAIIHTYCIIYYRLAVAIDANRAFAFVSRQHNKRSHVRSLKHLLAVLLRPIPWRSQAEQSRMDRRYLQLISIVSIKMRELIAIGR